MKPLYKYTLLYMLLRPGSVKKVWRFFRTIIEYIGVVYVIYHFGYGDLETILGWTFVVGFLWLVGRSTDKEREKRRETNEC